VPGSPSEVAALKVSDIDSGVRRFGASRIRETVTLSPQSVPRFTQGDLTNIWKLNVAVVARVLPKLSRRARYPRLLRLIPLGWYSSDLKT
jgi:hypothetical protein